MNLKTTSSWLLPGAAFLITGNAWCAAGWQSHEDMRQAAQQAVLAALGEPAEVVADSPDPRLRLPNCPEALTAVVPANSPHAGRVTAEVRCPGEQPWRLYLPVRINGTQPVVVAARALDRDTVLAPGDVRLARADNGTAAPGALHDPVFVVGRRLRRPAEEGQAVTAALLAAPTLVRRGQQVTVEALAGGLAVRMAGVARADGALGDTIQVESGTSGRVVQAVVRSAKSVEVLLR